MTLAGAAAAAESRAQDCHSRVADLRRGATVSGDAEVAHARARLEQAEARAVAAKRRLQEIRKYHEMQQLMRRLHVTGSGRGLRLPEKLDLHVLAPLRLKAFDWVSTGRVGLKPLWLAFVALGGEAGILEFDAFVHKAWDMSERDQSVLDQLCWEYETFGTL